MQAYQTRVISEKAELDERTKALNVFIASSDFYNKVDVAERLRLIDQARIMHQYSCILAARIDAFSGYGYGNCPKCGSVGISRERRPDGNDQCAQRHVYPSKEAIPC